MVDRATGLVVWQSERIEPEPGSNYPNLWEPGEKWLKEHKPDLNPMAYWDEA